MKKSLLCLCLLGIFFLTACQEKISSEKEIADSTEAKDAMESVKNTKLIAVKECEEYDPARTRDFWIKHDNVQAFYATDYVSADSTFFLKKNSADSVFFNASYIRGTPCGGKVYFEEYRISGEEGMKKYIERKHLAPDPRETVYWKKRLEEAEFKTLKQAIEQLACIEGFPELTEHLEQQVNKNVVITEIADPLIIKTKLKEYTKLYKY